MQDFGLATDGPTGDNTHVSTRVIGSQGYAAPEYVATKDDLLNPILTNRDTRAEEGVIGTKNGRQRMTSSEIEGLGFRFLVLFADYTERPAPLLFTPNFATVNLNCRNHRRHFYIIATVIHNRRPNRRHIVIFATVSHNRRNTRRNFQATTVPP
ncbi:hypothetical protein Fmac_028395 [Flemingia macrophylla]|uniref:Protein kinase domain-containing protein n=1 Tax=Flemingia macrophylla TaxID=520843 RepID=A0ABD1L7G0_9FABA